jgi:hypothetical protein
MRVSGQGAYTARYSAELSVRGTTAYTSTWQTRGTARGNAILIWDVSGASPVLVDSVIVQPDIADDSEDCPGLSARAVDVTTDADEIVNDGFNHRFRDTRLHGDDHGIRESTRRGARRYGR